MTSDPPPGMPRAWIVILGLCPPVIRTTVEEELRVWSGTWRVEVQMGAVSGWCSVRVIRDDGAARTLLLAPGEQTREAVRQALPKVLASLPRRATSLAEHLPPGIARDRRAQQRR